MEAIQLAQEKLKQLRNDEHERELAKLRENIFLIKILLQKLGYARGLKEGHAEGRAEGHAEGHAEGESIAKSKIVKNMLKNGYDDNIILELPNITKSDLEKSKSRPEPSNI